MSFLGALAVGALLPLAAAQALPSFARQTGQPCSTCHNGFPELTPFGRLFKLNGYTFTGGTSKLPHVAVMLQPAYTHTEAGQSGGAAPHFGPNNNVSLQQASLFYGGAIDSDLGLGAFAQATYDDASRRIGWDNTDIRMARTGSLFGSDLIYGVTVNNNPSVQDVWNTTPAWRFPYVSSTLAPTPGASTLIEGGLAQNVAGVGGYVFWNQLVYAEFSAYRSLPKGTLKTFGTDTGSALDVDGFVPYWRVALERDWDQNSLSFGTFGLAANLYPQRTTTAGSDAYTDIGIDSQYQFLGENHSFSVQASWINEQQSLHASQPLGLSSNTRNDLRSFNAKATYFYHNTYGATLGYFNTDGSSDATLYGTTSGSPNSNGWVMQLDYIPYNSGGPSFWTWLNVRYSLQYTWYTRFDGGSANYDGTGRKALDNNTLFLVAWVAF